MGRRGPDPLWARPLVLILSLPTLPGKLLEPHKYAALQKLDDPNEICAYEAIPRPQVLQAEHVREVVRALGGHSGAMGALQPWWGQPTGSDRVSKAINALPSKTRAWCGMWP